MPRAVSQLPFNFGFQSAFDDVLLERAISEQPPNQAIVPSTLRQAPGLGGHVVGLASDSDAPIAIRFNGKAETGALILRPGQVIRPGAFSGLEYGLPFGWLGGGLGSLLIGHDPDCFFDMGPQRNEVLFHRTRLKITNTIPGAFATRNWPVAFPWLYAVRGANSINQKGQPLLSIRPTRTIMRLRLNAAADKVVRLLFWGAADFDDTTAIASHTYADVTFAGNAGPGTPFPLGSLPDDVARLDTSNGGVLAYGLGDAALLDQYIDVLRYGEI